MNNERLIKALKAKAISEKEQAMMELDMLTQYAVAIGEHTTNHLFIEGELALQKLIDAEDKIEMLNKLYPDIKL
jgi:hypothetical protein